MCMYICVFCCSRQTESKSHGNSMTMRNATYLTSPQTLRRSRARTPKPNAPPETTKLVKVTMSNFSESAFYQSFSQVSHRVCDYGAESVFLLCIIQSLQALKKAGVEGQRTPKGTSTPQSETMNLVKEHWGVHLTGLYTFIESHTPCS